MANKKKLRRKFMTGEVKYEDLSQEEQKYINKYARKIEREVFTGKDSAAPTFKEVPCQKLPGKKVLVPVDTLIVEGSDGLLYIEEECPKNLVVSEAWKSREVGRKLSESRKKREEQEQAVVNLKPTTLGEE